MKRAVVLAALAACAHTPDLALRPDPSPPDGSTTEVFTARDGTQLLARHWVVTAGEPRGAVVIMHGLKDHSARYATFAKRLVDAGYDVHAFDLRGHGRSAGPRVSPDEWTGYVDDLDRFLTAVEAREPHRPIFLFGHSMGGAIATLTAERHHPKLAGLILSGPALAVAAPPLLVAATRMSGFLTPKFPGFDLPNSKFSSDPAAEKQIGADPLISQPPAPVKTAAGLIEGMREIWANTDQLTMPILAMHGTRDQLTAPWGSKALIDAVPTNDRTLRIYDKFAHDLLHEPTGKQVEDDIVAWLGAHTGGPAFVAPPPYTGGLVGEPRGWAQAVELTGGVATDNDRVGFTGTFDLDIAIPSPIGYHAALTARYASNYRTVALRPLGVAARAGGTALGISGGIAFVTGKDFASSVGVWIEQPLGPLHVGAQLETAKYFHDVPAHGPIWGDLVWTTVSLRLGGDRAYWPGMRAGVGPVIMAGSAWLQDAQAYIITAGLELYGAD